LAQPTYRDYYKILGIARTADDKEIKAAYRKLARKYHPDVNPGDSAAEAKFKEISEAHEVLSDPHKRSQYDRYGDQWKMSTQNSGPTVNTAGWGFGGFGSKAQTSNVEYGDDSALHDMFESLFGGFKSRNTKAANHGEDVEYALDLTLEEAIHGGRKQVNVTVEDLCPKCGGSGSAKNKDGVYTLGGACTECRGHGRKNSQVSAEVTIPAGIQEGKRLRLAGKGSAGLGGKRGDLFLLVRIRNSAHFDRKGNDLFADVSIPYTVAALGGETEVRTLNGVRTLPVPRGIQSGQKIRIAGQGIPATSDHPAGDFYAVVKVTVPKDLSTREQELITELARLRGDKIK